MYDVLLLATVFLRVYEMYTSIYVIKYNALPTCHRRRKIKNAHQEAKDNLDRFVCMWFTEHAIGTNAVPRTELAKDVF